MAKCRQIARLYWSVLQVLRVQLALLDLQYQKISCLYITSVAILVLMLLGWSPGKITAPPFDTVFSYLASFDKRSSLL